MEGENSRPKVKNFRAGCQVPAISLTRFQQRKSRAQRFLAVLNLFPGQSWRCSICVKNDVKIRQTPNVKPALLIVKRTLHSHLDKKKGPFHTKL